MCLSVMGLPLIVGGVCMFLFAGHLDDPDISGYTYESLEASFNDWLNEAGSYLVAMGVFLCLYLIPSLIGGCYMISGSAAAFTWAAHALCMFGAGVCIIVLGATTIDTDMWGFAEMDPDVNKLRWNLAGVGFLFSALLWALARYLMGKAGQETVNVISLFHGFAYCTFLGLAAVAIWMLTNSGDDDVDDQTPKQYFLAFMIFLAGLSNAVGACAGAYSIPKTNGTVNATANTVAHAV